MTYNKDLLDKAKRHPEKQKNPDRPMGKKPDWIRVRAPQGKIYHETRQTVRESETDDYRVPGGGLPQYRRMLGETARYLHDHGRGLHPRLFLL